MRFFYTLAILALIAAPASAQRDDQQVPFARTALMVSGQPDLNVTIMNNMSATDFPPIYSAPDSSASSYIGRNVFTRILASGDTVGVGPVITTTGVTGTAVAIVNAAGEASTGCDDTEVANAAALSGNIAVFLRGACPFIAKFQTAERAGAIGVVLVSDDRDNGNLLLGGMSGAPAEGQPDIMIPGVIIAQGIGQPILDELLFTSTVLTMKIFDNLTTAAENGPATTASGLELRGANPFSVSTDVRVFTENTEAVRIELFNVRGQQVATLFDGTVSGERAVTLSSANVAPGVYFVRATGETFRKQLQVTVVR